MTIKEFYSKSNDDYAEVLGAFGKEERVLKYLRKFPENELNKKIREALDAKDYETAFREAHNLKGMCMNLALSRFSKLSSDLTESLRNGPTGDVEAFFVLVDEEYNRVSELVKQIN